MATRTAKGKTEAAPEMPQTRFVMQLKKEGKHVAHYHSDVEGEMSSAFKDSYMPHEHFTDLGKPETITVTIVPGDDLNG